MRVRIWGSRGSLPSPGCHTGCYGGNTTCLEIRLNDGTLIIVDAGSGIRALGDQLMKEKDTREIFIFITHCHWDHVMGFPFFKPAYSKEFHIHVRGGPLAKSSLQKYLAHQMEPPYFPVDFNLLQAEFDFTVGNPAEQHIGTACLKPIPISHPNGGYGFQLEEAGRRFLFLTDNELGMVHGTGLDHSAYEELCRGAQLVLHDAQYTNEEYQTTKGWGHSTFSQVLDLAKAAHMERLGMTHHDPARPDRALAVLEKQSRKILRRSGSKVKLFAVREGMELIV